MHHDDEEQHKGVEMHKKSNDEQGIKQRAPLQSQLQHQQQQPSQSPGHQALTLWALTSTDEPNFGSPVPEEKRPIGAHVSLPRRLQWIHFVPIQLVLSCFGLAGLASTWALAAQVFHLDSMKVVSHVWAWWVLVHTIGVFLLYAAKAICTMGEVQREWTSHNAFNYFCGMPLSVFILGGMVQLLWPASDAEPWAARCLWIIGTVGDLVFNVHAIHRWLGGQGDEDARSEADPTAQKAHDLVMLAEKQHNYERRGPSGDALPATSLSMAHRLSLFSPFFLTSPSTGFYASLLGTTMWSSSSFSEEFLWLPWSLGALMFLLFFVILVCRLVLVGMIGPEARPTMLLPLANLAMATVAYVQLNSLSDAEGRAQPYDNFARVMFFVTCVYGCTLVLLVRRLFIRGFSTKWFSTTFPLSALASLMVLHEKHQATRVSTVFALLVLATATVWNIGVMLLTYTALLTGNMCVPQPEAAPHLLPGVQSRSNIHSIAYRKYVRAPTGSRAALAAGSAVAQYQSRRVADLVTARSWTGGGAAGHCAAQLLRRSSALRVALNLIFS